MALIEKLSELGVEFEGGMEEGDEEQLGYDEDQMVNARMRNGQDEYYGEGEGEEEEKSPEDLLKENEQLLTVL